MCEEDRVTVNAVRAGAGWAAASLMYTGRVEGEHCEICGHPKQGIDHLIWDCPATKEARESEDPILGERSSLVLALAQK